MRYFGPVKGTWIAFYYIQKGERLEETDYVHHARLSIFGLVHKRHRAKAAAGNALRYHRREPSERDALVVRGYLSEEDQDNGAEIKKAIEAVLSDFEFELQSETAEPSRARA